NALRSLGCDGGLVGPRREGLPVVRLFCIGALTSAGFWVSGLEARLGGSLMPAETLGVKVEGRPLGAPASGVGAAGAQHDLPQQLQPHLLVLRHPVNVSEARNNPTRPTVRCLPMTTPVP